MRAVIQNVSKAAVHVAGTTVGNINRGMLVLLAISANDQTDDLLWLVRKISQLRILCRKADTHPESLLDWPEAQVLVISQFTLLASTRKGTRPSWHRAANPDVARQLYDQFITHFAEIIQRPIATGTFGNHMELESTNDGPITLIIDSHARE